MVLMLVLHSIEYISLNSSLLLEHLANTRKKLLSQNLPNQGIGIINFSKPFLKFYRRYYDLISKFHIGLKFLLHQVLSEPEFYGDLVGTSRRKLLALVVFSAVY